MMDKEYFRIYYKNHKKEYERRKVKWSKENPQAAKTISKRYRDKVRDKGEKVTNQSEYPVKPLKILFIESYGEDLENTRDDITHSHNRTRVVCIDCIHYRRGHTSCSGWDKCPYKEEILEEIKK